MLDKASQWSSVDRGEAHEAPSGAEELLEGTEPLLINGVAPKVARAQWVALEPCAYGQH